MTTSMSDIHDSETCTLGPNGQPCAECAAAKEYEAKHGKCCERCDDADRQEQEQLGEANLLKAIAGNLAWVRLHKVRDAILDVLDARQWQFNVEDESDDESARRLDFAEAVVAVLGKER